VNEETAGLELAVEFYRLTEFEPPFRTSLDEALRAAERGGRRRRARTRAVRGGVAVLAVAASAALFIAWPNQDRALKTPSVVVVPTTARPLTSMDRLEQLLREIARPSGGVVRVQRRGADSEIVASARTPDGIFELAADVSTDNSDVLTGQEMCQSEGFSCEELSSTSSVAVWARDDPAKTGHVTLQLTAKAPDAKWLWVQIDNEVDPGDGSRTIGPGWKDVGITEAGLRQAVADSGLTTTD
jgi:hypothetical protein